MNTLAPRSWNRPGLATWLVGVALPAAVALSACAGSGHDVPWADGGADWGPVYVDGSGPDQLIGVDGSGPDQLIAVDGSGSADSGKKLCSYDWTGNGKCTVAISGPYTKIYIMLTNRAPDPAGLGYWNSVGYTKQQVTAFASDGEAMQEFGGFTSPTAILQHIYQTAFHRTASSGDIGYWAPQFDTTCQDTSKSFASFTTCVDPRLGAFVMTLHDGALGADQQILQNLIQVGDYWAAQLLQHNCPRTSFDRTVLQQVTASPSSVTAAKQAIDQQIAWMEQQQATGPGTPPCP